jgi:hypothetical protein
MLKILCSIIKNKRIHKAVFFLLLHILPRIALHLKTSLSIVLFHTFHTLSYFYYFFRPTNIHYQEHLKQNCSRRHFLPTACDIQDFL